jgi:undecaprenyl phosphate N,N'-diacetylbacillosamine 1-phosphate transferase
MYKSHFKRPLDFVLSLFAIIALFPVLIVIAVLTKINLGNPVLFIQKRPGKDKRIFNIYKFRTMKVTRDEEGKLLDDEKRLNRFGEIIRSLSLDELPELFNILKGDMSIVGPRPQLIKDMVFFNKRQLERQKILPGLTGLAQVNGRNSISWEVKIEYDLKYIENITFLGDCKIIYKTLLILLFNRGMDNKGMNTAGDLGDYLLKEKKISEKKYNSCIDKYIKILGDL